MCAHCYPDADPCLSLQGSDILDLFVYPESRAKFLSLLGRAGLLPELRSGLGASDSVQILDFWSYIKDFGNVESPLP